MKKICFLVLLTFFINSCEINPEMLSVNDSPLQIHDIQGCAHISPLNGKTVQNIDGVVIWKVDNGFFMESNMPDDKDCSSEGIFVFTGNYPNLIPGDFVSVSGQVDEYLPGNESDANLTVTEIKMETVRVISTGNPLPEPILIGTEGRVPPGKIIEDDQFGSFDIVTDGLDFYESLEGMRVEINNAVVVGPSNSYGEVIVIPQETLSQNIISEEGALISSENDNNPERILISLPNGFNKKIALGDHFSDAIIGILDYEYGNYRVIETNSPKIVKNSNVKNYQVSDLTTKEIRIASYNVENLNRFDDGRMKKLVTQITGSLGSPDILILQEIQDDSGTEDDGITSAARTLSELVNLVSQRNGPNYEFIDPEPIDGSSGGVNGGNIRTVVLYRTDRGLQLINSQIAWLDTNNSVFTNSRQPLISEFKFHQRSLFIIGVHLISNNTNSPLYGSIQPPEKPEENKRIQQSLWIANAVKKIRNHVPDSSIILAGDFNDMPWSNTLSTLESEQLVNLADQIPESERYSILFEGNAMLFDQILIDQTLVSSVKNVTIEHLNTSLNEKDQASDHDPILVDLELETSGKSTHLPLVSLE